MYAAISTRAQRRMPHQIADRRCLELRDRTLTPWALGELSGGP